jgi:hypothetical protein
MDDIKYTVEDFAYVVAVDSDPAIWAVNCELCDDIVSIETQDEDVVDNLLLGHIESHSTIEPL